MVGCDYSVGLNAGCSGGKPVAGALLFPTLVIVKDNELVKLQVITNAFACDDSEQVPIEYCLDWGDGSTPTSGFFIKGNAANVEFSHTYRYAMDDHYQSTQYHPKVTIKTGCGGIRTVGNDNSCVVRVYRSDVDITSVDSEYANFSMSNYHLYPDFNSNNCGSGQSVPSCYGTESKCEGGVTLVCNDGNWMPTQGRCTDPNGVYQEMDPSYWTSIIYSPPTNNETQSVIDTSNETSTDVIGDTIGKITTVINENKLLAIGGLALFGGFMLFSGHKRRR